MTLGIMDVLDELSGPEYDEPETVTEEAAPMPEVPEVLPEPEIPEEIPLPEPPPL